MRTFIHALWFGDSDKFTTPTKKKRPSSSNVRNSLTQLEIRAFSHS